VKSPGGADAGEDPFLGFTLSLVGCVYSRCGHVVFLSVYVLMVGGRNLPKEFLYCTGFEEF
jgi:hypothetical protein